jgi:cytochrome P450
METLQDTAGEALLPAPRPHQGRLSFLEFGRKLRDNMIATYPQEAYERDIVERKMIGRRRYIVNEPAAIKQVLIDNASNYRKTEIARRLLEPGLGKGLITSEGDTWKLHRRIMAPSFDHRSIAAYAPLMTGAAKTLLTEWDGLGSGATLDVAAAMMEVTLNIISRTMFSSDSNEIVKIMERSAGRYQAEMRPNVLDLLGFPAWLAGFRRRHVASGALAEFDRVIDRLIESRASQPADGPKDLLSRLIAARDAETGGRMSAQEVRDHVITIFMAGHETTAMAMTWTWFLLSQHPAEEARLHAEIDAVLGGNAPGYEDLPKLVYTRMVIEESMRIYPPVHTISRQALADDTLVGTRIPKGSTVMIVPWLLHRHIRLWDHPGRFDPQRFSPEASASRHRFAYLPFGGGRRICIGAAFAIAEATLLLATLAQRYRLVLAPGHRVEPQGLITLRPRHGMNMVLTPRS